MMLRHTLLLFVMLLTIVSCYELNAPKKPENLIAKDKMIQILMDAKLMSNGITGIDKRVLDSSNIEPQNYLYEKHNIDSVQFAQSNTYYSYHLEEYKEIYETLKDTLLKLKKHYKTVVETKKKEKKKQDSLAKLKKVKDTIAKEKHETKDKGANPDLSKKS